MLKNIVLKHFNNSVKSLDSCGMRDFFLRRSTEATSLKLCYFNEYQLTLRYSNCLNRRLEESNLAESRQRDTRVSVFLVSINLKIMQ